MTYRPCICGHAEGQHKSNGSSFPHPLIFGVCLAPGCECREYVSPEDHAAKRERLNNRVRADLHSTVWEASQVMSYDEIRQYVEGIIAEIASDEP